MVPEDLLSSHRWEAEQLLEKAEKSEDLRDMMEGTDGDLTAGLDAVTDDEE